MIRVFIDGPIAGDVRTDFPDALGPTIRIPIPRRITTCDCNPEEPLVWFEDSSEVVEYRAICWGPKVVIMSSVDGADDQAILRSLSAWITTDLTATVWRRTCRDRRAFA